MSEIKSHFGNISAGFIKIENIPVFLSVQQQVMFFAKPIKSNLVLLIWSREFAERLTFSWSSHFVPIYLKPRADDKSG
jgi:hypothetical protein